jgi:hypothetical protein
VSDRRTQAMIVVAIAGFLGGAAVAIVRHVQHSEAPTTATPAPTEPVRTSSRADGRSISRPSSHPR